MLTQQSSIALTRRHALAFFLDFFRVLLIDLHKFVAGIRVYFEQFIELGVYGLRVAVFGALNEKRHGPRRKRGDRMPFKLSENGPSYRISNKNDEGRRPCGHHAEVGEPVSALREFHAL